MAIGGGGALTIPHRSTYLQYKHNTSILIRWIVTTASSCASKAAPSNKNTNNKKRATKAPSENPEITLTGLVSLSNIIAEAEEPVPNSIYALFDSVIRARTAAYKCFEQLWAECPDDDLKISNESHLAFINALKTAWDILGGAIWRKDYPDGRKPQKPQKQTPDSDEVALTTETIEFFNRFKGLDVDPLPVEEEEELETIATKTPEATSASDTPTVKPRGKGKKRRTEPLENYKIKSETEIYFGVCFFVRDVLELKRYFPP